MLRSWVFVGFTGHRNLADPTLISRAIRTALGRIAAHSEAPLAAVSSLASGSDTLFAEAACEAGLPLLVLLPLAVEEFRKDFDNDADWQRVERLLARAVRWREEPALEDRADAYLECGIRTIDECDLVLAVWDGGNAAGRGGTGDIVAYARAQEKPLLWIHAATGEMREERMDRLPAVDAAEKQLGPSGSGVTGRAALEASFAHHNEAANRLRPRAVNLNLTLVLLQLIASAISFAALVFTNQPLIASLAAPISFGLLGAALALPFLFRRAHREWMTHRLRAEIFRSALAVWRIPQPELVFEKLRQPAEDRLQRSILLQRLLHPPPPEPLEQVRAALLSERVDAQLNYYADHAAAAGRRHRWLRTSATALTATAILASISVAAHLYPSGSDVHRLVRYIGMVLPLLSAAAVSAITALDLGRRTARYREMASLLQHARNELALTRTWAGLRRAALEVERSLLLEIWEWYSIERFSPRR